MPGSQYAGSFNVAIEGIPLPAEVKNLFNTGWVESSTTASDAFVLQFRDPDRLVLAKARARIGAKLEISVDIADNTPPAKLFQGEITAVEVEFDGEGTATVIRGYDLTHRLRRGTRVAAYPNMTMADIVRKVASRASIPVGKVHDAKGVHGRPHTQIGQHGIDDWTFLRHLAGEVGFVVGIQDGKLDFRPLVDPPPAPPAPGHPPPPKPANPLLLTPGENLLTFRSSISAAAQVPSVECRGWDRDHKQAVVATKIPALVGTEISGVDPVALAGMFGAPPTLVPGTADGQGAADHVARSTAERLAMNAVELDAVVLGAPQLRAGIPISLRGMGEPFDGTYTPIRVRHCFDPESGYVTEISVGAEPSEPDRKRAPWAGVVTGVVSDVRDPAKVGRVKVTFPWLSTDFASGWAPTVQAGAGNGYGTVVLPEVGDEVMLAFEHGDPDRPIVLGGLYNGKDLIPKTKVGVVDGNSGQITTRAYVSRKHHNLQFIEDEGITLASGDGKFSMVLDQKQQAITIESGEAIIIKAQNGIKIDSGTGPLELEGQKVTVKSTTEVDIKAGSQAKVNGTSGIELTGATAKLAGQGMTEVTANGILTVKGSLVKIN